MLENEPFGSLQGTADSTFVVSPADSVGAALLLTCLQTTAVRHLYCVQTLTRFIVGYNCTINSGLQFRVKSEFLGG